MIERIVEKIHWENTASNQRTVSMILGWTIGFIIMFIFKFILA